jgi:lipopolysaccharide/colanic/teichoic acid biosynthesis glycosyltransferase
MNTTRQTRVSSSPSTVLSYHHFKSTYCKNGKVLIITAYDYFLTKSDLRKLFKTYQQVYLVPKGTDDVLVGKRIAPIFSRNNNVHLVTNPAYNDANRIVYEMVIERSVNIKTSTVYDFCESFLKKVYISETMDNCSHAPSSFKYFNIPTRLLKKAVDVAGSAVLMSVSLPLWVISAFKIKKESPSGPILYRQMRVGIREEEFECVKFRSMRPDAEVDGAAFSSKNDPRIFGYGKFMRATRIDELPQLINIFNGQLSLVGPRPERKVFTDTFDEEIPYYTLRHAVKPGISGYAQIMYNYGAGVKDARHKLMYDLYYIKHWSLKLEIQILFNTIKTVLLKKGQ